MACEFCHDPNVIIKIHEGTGQPMLWDRQGERPHNCPVPTVYCPSCRKRRLQLDVCEHYKALGYRQGENEQFFINKILHPPQPKPQGRRIGTSAGYTRTKNTICSKCGKDLNGWKTERIDRHVQEHEDEEKKKAPQTRLF